MGSEMGKERERNVVELIEDRFAELHVELGRLKDLGDKIEHGEQPKCGKETEKRELPSLAELLGGLGQRLEDMASSIGVERTRIHKLLYGE